MTGKRDAGEEGKWMALNIPETRFAVAECSFLEVVQTHSVGKLLSSSLTAAWQMGYGQSALAANTAAAGIGELVEFG